MHGEHAIDSIPFASTPVETRRSNPFVATLTDQRTVEVLEALELLYWNDWESACKFQDEPRQNESMRKIGVLQEMKYEFKKDALGR